MCVNTIFQTPFKRKPIRAFALWGVLFDFVGLYGFVVFVIIVVFVDLAIDKEHRKSFYGHFSTIIIP